MRKNYILYMTLLYPLILFSVELYAQDQPDKVELESEQKDVEIKDRIDELNVLVGKAKEYQLDAQKFASEAKRFAESAQQSAQQATGVEVNTAAQEIGDTWKRIDQTLSASLAATLAGLALAAAAFMSVIESTIRAGGSNEMEARSKSAQDATKNLIRSFYGFLVLLVNSVTLDPIEVAGIEWSFPAVADLGLSGGGMTVGVVYLVLGARSIASLLEVSENGT